MGSFSERIKKKYDSEYLAANTTTHNEIENARFLKVNFGNEFEKIELKLPGGTIAK